VLDAQTVEVAVDRGVAVAVSKSTVASGVAVGTGATLAGADGSLEPQPIRNKSAMTIPTAMAARRIYLPLGNRRNLLEENESLQTGKKNDLPEQTGHKSPFGGRWRVWESDPRHRAYEANPNA
jgi:hypothetical protein